MIEFLQRLRQRKLVQWSLAYLAAAFAIVQAVDLVAGHFDWSPSVVRYLILAFAVGFCVILVLAWYHGDHGAQRVSGTELLIVALLLAIGGGVVGYLGPRVIAQRNPVAASTPGAAAIAAARVPISAKSIAVLPFENLSSDKENAYFVAGMQDLILTKLSTIGDLKVVSRTSTLKYQSRPENLRKVAAELGVATIVEGSVQKLGKDVMINVQLIDARSDTHLWAETYTRTLDNIFGVEGEVAARIAGALHAKLSPALSTRLAAVATTNPAAYDLLMRSQYNVLRAVLTGTPIDWKAAIALHRRAVALDPKFALSWAYMSMAQLHVVAQAGDEDVAAVRRDARHNAEHAVQLQPGLAVAHRALGKIHAELDHDDAAALQEFNQSLALDPNDGYTLAAVGEIQLKQGHADAALDTFQRAAILNPRDFIMLLNVAGVNKTLGRWTEADAWYRRALALEPGSVRARLEYAHAIVYSRGNVTRALAIAQGDAPPLKLVRVELLTYGHKFSDAIALLDSIPDTYFGPGGLKSQQLALIHWLAGDSVQARPLFAKALPVDRAALGGLQGPDRANVLNSVGLDEIGAGQVTAGLTTIAQSEAILAKASATTFDPSQHVANARAYVMANRNDLAVPVLANALATRDGGRFYSPVMLWIDPWWDPIRKDPRFQALLAQYARFKPAATPPASTSSS